MKFKTILHISFVLLCVIPVGLTAWFYHSQANEHLLISTQSNIARQMDNAKADLLRRFTEQKTTTQQLAGHPIIMTMIECLKRSSPNDCDDEKKAFTSLNVFYPAGSQFIFVSSNGAELLRVPSNTISPPFSLSNINKTLISKTNDNTYLTTSAQINASSGKNVALIVNVPATNALSLPAFGNLLDGIGNWMLIDNSLASQPAYSLPFFPNASLHLKDVLGESTERIAKQTKQGLELDLVSAKLSENKLVFYTSRVLNEDNFALFYTVSQAALNDYLSRQQTTSSHIKWVIFAGILILILLASFFIAQPINTLVSNMAALQKGTKRLEPSQSSLTEINTLKASVNKILEDNETVNRNLNKRFMERTIELNKAISDLRELANRDTDTGLFNRRYLNERMSQEMNRISRYKSSMTVILFEADNLVALANDLNDDEFKSLTVNIGNILQKSLRASDIVARVDKLKFCVVLTGEAATTAYDLVEKLRTTLQTISLKNDVESFGVTYSFAVNSIDTNTPENVNLAFETLYDKTNSALVLAQESGRNQVISVAAL